MFYEMREQKRGLVNVNERKLFISYSHKDADWLELVQTHLAVLRMQGQVTAWSDKELLPGDQWEKGIEAAMAEADVAVLLVSPNFLASEFIMRTELPHLLAICNGEKHGRLRRIMPLILEPCLWPDVPVLKALEVRPKGHELSAGNEHQRQLDLTEFAKSVTKVLFETPKPDIIDGSTEPTPSFTIVGEKSYATLELRLSHCERRSYRVELSFTWSGDRKWDFVRRFAVYLDLDAFSKTDDVETYAADLRRALFPDDVTWSGLTEAKACADRKNVPLRMRVCIEPSARELHAINWEKLTFGGGPENPLSSSSTVFARYALCYGAGWRAALSRQSKESRALLIGIDEGSPATGAGTSLNDLQTVAILLSGAGITCTVSQGWHDIDSLSQELLMNDGIDYLYMLIGTFPSRDNDTMICPPGHGNYAATDDVRRDIIAALHAMEKPPRLVIVAPGSDDNQVPENRWPWLVRLAYEIVEQDVLSVLTRQGSLDWDAWHTFLSTFFGEIIQHGLTDKAAQSAREKISGSSASWAPVLVSRLRSARLWYIPHLMDETRRDSTWHLILSRIAENRCTPIIGPGVDYRIARFREQIARDWADRYQYPLALREQVALPQVAQYIAATRGDAQMEEDYYRDLRNFALKRYGHLLEDAEKEMALDKMLSAIAEKVSLKEPSDPHSILAFLPFTIYVTANFNNFLADAIRLSDRKPQELVFNSDLRLVDINTPDRDHPLVYHLFGRIDDMQSLVLTEDDYFDFLIEFWRERERIPSVVRRTLTSSSLLFLGFNLNQWDFRVLFRSLLKEQSSQRRRRQLHVAVQVDPDDDQITDPDRAREYMEKYFEGFGESDVSIYWGSSEDFLGELKRRWNMENKP